MYKITFSLMISFAAVAAADKGTHAQLRSSALYVCKQEEVEPPYTRLQKALFWTGVFLLVVLPVAQAASNGGNSSDKG